MYMYNHVFTASVNRWYYLTLGEKFLQVTSKMASEKTTPQLQAGGACTSVAVAIGGLEGRYPEAIEGWDRREKLLKQSIEWQSFQQNSNQVITNSLPPLSLTRHTTWHMYTLYLLQLSSWINGASESFLVRFDLGTSLETTEDLEMEFQEFQTRAQVTITW